MLTPRREASRVRRRRFRNGTPGSPDRDLVATEEPMEIRISHVAHGRRATHSVSVTMRTPGDDFELAAGFLAGEGLVAGRREIREVTYCAGEDAREYNVVEVRLARNATFDPAELQRNFYQTSSCGVCGKASLEAVEVRGCPVLPAEGMKVPPATVQVLPDRLREAQRVFEKTGGLHAAGLFDAEGTLRVLREDVGRHNAVDKVVGHEFLAGRIPVGEGVLVVSGRASFEIMQKALAAGIPFVVAVGAPSSLAVDLARRFNMTLAGFTRPDGFNVYAGEERLGGAAAGEAPTEGAGTESERSEGR